MTHNLLKECLFVHKYVAHTRVLHGYKLPIDHVKESNYKLIMQFTYYINTYFSISQVIVFLQTGQVSSLTPVPYYVYFISNSTVFIPFKVRLSNSCGQYIIRSGWLHLEIIFLKNCSTNHVVEHAQECNYVLMHINNVLE